MPLHWIELMFSDEPIPLTPINFFAIGCDCHYQEYDPKKELSSKFILPKMSELCAEDSFAEVAMAWGFQGLTLQVKVDQSFTHPFYPNFSKGDSVELLIDTRDVKSAGFNTRFCHHFFFLPQEVEGYQAGEVTHFRTEDRHELCDGSSLIVNSLLKKSSAVLKVFIPAHCLFGYDPEQFDRLGFAYRINRYHGAPQHFSVVSQDYQIEQQPSLWSSVKLIHENGTLRQTSGTRSKNR